MATRLLKKITFNHLGNYTDSESPDETVCYKLAHLVLHLLKALNERLPEGDFIESHIVNFTKANPGIVVYLKPKRHAAPYLKAEYLNGYEETIPLLQFNTDQIAQWLGVLRGRSGQQLMRLRKDWHTDVPSIQGVWHPFLFKDTSLNVTDIRDKKLHEFIQPAPPATDLLLEMKKYQQESEGNR